MPTLAEAVDDLADEGGVYRIEAPQAWAQGRTLYGGMTAALSAGAAKRAFTGLPPLRSAQFAFIGPASGRLALRPTILRQGRSATIVGVDCEGEAGLAARATLVFGADRESQVRHDLAPAPQVPPPDDCPPFLDDRLRPGFSGNLDYRLAAGARPVTPGAAPQFTIWVRLRDEVGVDPEVALLALADSPPAAAAVAFPGPAPLSTMTWTLDLDPPIDGGGWRLLRSVSEQARAGYSLQEMALWNPDGRRIAAGRQTVALFV